MKTITLILAALILSSCASNGFKKFYSDQTGGLDVTKAAAVIVPKGDPNVVSGTDPKSDAQKMTEDGYQLLGFSSFYGPSGAEDGALKQGRDVHAAVVIVYSDYKDTLTGMTPITTPTSQTSYTNVNASAYGSGGYANAYGSGTTTTYGTQTQYIPYTVNRSNYFASYWIKLNPKYLAVGCHVADLSDEQRRSIASNKGVVISAVIKGSPAFKADLMKGDIIKAIGGEEIYDVKSYHAAARKFKGQKVKIQYVRDGKSVTKKIQLGGDGV